MRSPAVLRGRRLRALAPLAIALAMSASAQAPETEWAPETFTLANGMQAVVLPDHRAPVVTHMIWYRVGSADEVKGKSGLAHFFEHLMFKATDRIPAGEYSKIVARNGGQDNASTSQDYTEYYVRIAKDRLPDMMQLEADRMTGLKLSEEEVTSERDVVKEERRQNTESNPGAILYEKAMALLYEGHPYAVPTVGHMEEVAKLSREDAVDWYKSWYAPEHATLVVAGDITAAELKPLAEKYYGSIPRKGVDHPRDWPAVSPLPKSQAVTHTDPKVRQPQWSRYWLGVAAGDPQSEALTVGLEILGGGRTSRLNRELVENQAVAINAYAFSNEQRARGYISIGGSPAPGKSLDDVRKGADAILKKFLAEGPTDQELTRAKRSVAAAAIFARDSQVAMANWYGSQIVVGQTPDQIAHWDDRIRAVTREQVMAAMKAYLSGTNFVDGSLLQGGK